MDKMDLLVVGIVLFVSIASLHYLSLYAPTVEMATDDPWKELTTTDVLADKSITGDEVAYKGVHLGSTLDEVVDLLGAPDRQDAFEEGAIVNLEYGSRFGYNESVLVVHLEAGAVERMTFFMPLTEQFTGFTRLGQDKRGAYDLMGIPAKQIPTTTHYWIYTYPSRGIDILLYNKELKGFSIYAPSGFESNLK